ncbi:MAG TPA: phage tail tape measure protein, partial [Maribacter sp.]|nr:phage tail tape measure protein [Maribacter sp.]
LNKGLGNVNVPVNINIPKNANTQLTNLNKNVKNAGASARGAAKNFDSMRNSLRGALTYIAKYDAAREFFNLFAQTLRDGVSSAIAFEKEMVKVSQVTGQTMKQLRGLEREITRNSTGFGVSSGSLIKTSRVLAQTGMSARDARIALEALAKTTLAATFDDITSTTETAIAAMRQFGMEASKLESLLGKINVVAGNF